MNIKQNMKEFKIIRIWKEKEDMKIQKSNKSKEKEIMNKKKIRIVWAIEKQLKENKKEKK